MQDSLFRYIARSILGLEPTRENKPKLLAHLRDRAIVVKCDSDLAKDLARDHAKGRINRREWLTARDELQARVDMLRASIRRDQRTVALSPFVAQSATLRGRWPRLTVDERRAILKAVLDKVVVHAALRGRNTFDPELIEPIWRV